MANKVKNIVLLSDQKGSCIDSILSTGLFNIKLLIVPYKNNVDTLQKKYGSRIEKYIYFIPSTNDEFQAAFKSDYDLTYDEIECYRSTQFKCFRYHNRFIFDDNTNNCIYHTALKFFLNYFKNNSIDCVFSRIIEHGSIHDSLVFDIASKHNIPVFVLSISSSFGNDILYSLLDYNKKTFINISSVDKCTPNINKYLSILNSNYGNNKILRLPFSKLINKFINKKHKSIKECINWFFKYRIMFYINNFKTSSIKDLYKIREDISFMQIIKGILYVNKLKRYYNKNSHEIIDGENYIFFPLHMEPEATTLVRTTLFCQLFLIEQIASILPKGWYLYVKEHPDEFYQVQMDKYMYKNIWNFRNIDFYKRINNIKNVKLIKINVSSSELISKSKAVTTIAGSSLIESVAKNKPLIVWGNGCTFVELLNEVFLIKKLSDLKNAFYNVENGYFPNYKDFRDVVEKYVFTINYNNFYETNSTICGIFKLIYSLLY